MTELPRKDYYGALRLPPGASEAVVRRRFKRLAKRLHPDVNRAADAAERFREIREAFEVLTDPARRAVVESWFSPRPRKPWRTTARAGAAPPPVSPAKRRPMSPLWTAGTDRAWSFGCFGVLAFVLVFVGTLSSATSLAQATLIALGVALAVGFVAALGGDRVRESLLWLLCWFW